jgi:hypothetical protein
MKPVAAILALILSLPLAADEGMWPYNQFPKDAIAQKHKLDVSADFLDRLRLASVRIAGGSGAFVSSSGLILTNQHLIERCIPDVKIGFYAGSATEEHACPGIDASVLLSIEDVTSKVKGTGKDTVSGAALQQRNAAIARVEKECTEKSGNTCSVVGFSRAAATICINTRSTANCGSFSRQRKTWRFSDASATASPTCATASTWRSCARMKTASPRPRRIS